MSLMEVRSLSFAYGKKAVFQDVSFCLEPGQIFCLVGPNGCGKTTLVHCVLSHLKPRSGSVLVRGKEVSSYTDRELAAELAYVPQTHTRAFPYQTLDVVSMGRIRKHRWAACGKEDREAALACMERLGIGHLWDAPYTTLSGGELQTVLLARAIAQESSILVLDEPGSHLDIRHSLELNQRLAALAKEQNTAVLLSTHDLNQPLDLLDNGADVKMALMENGELSEASSPLEMLDSDLLGKLYGIESRLLTVNAGSERHFVATWKEEP